jgi:hypothetical protein
MTTTNSNDQKKPYPVGAYPTATYTTTNEPGNTQQPVVVVQQPGYVLPTMVHYDKHPQSIVW